MWITRRTDYATRAVLALALDPDGQARKMHELAEATGTPVNVLEQVLPQLRGAGIVRSGGVERWLPAQPSPRGDHLGPGRPAHPGAAGAPISCAAPREPDRVRWRSAAASGDVGRMTARPSPSSMPRRSPIAARAAAAGEPVPVAIPAPTGTARTPVPCPPGVGGWAGGRRRRRSVHGAQGLRRLLHSTRRNRRSGRWSISAAPSCFAAIERDVVETVQSGSCWKS